MSERDVTLEAVVDLALQLTPAERVRLIERVASTLTEALASGVEKKPRRSMRGALSDLNLNVSREDIDEIRREMLANFPREDIA